MLSPVFVVLDKKTTLPHFSPLLPLYAERSQSQGKKGAKITKNVLKTQQLANNEPNIISSKNISLDKTI